jgi:hypothetical protein
MIAGAGTADVTPAGELCLLPGGHQGSLAVNKVCMVTDLDNTDPDPQVFVPPG